MRGLTGLDKALQKAHTARKTQPDEKPGEGTSSDKESRRKRDPYAQAFEAIHELARERIAESNAKPDDEFGWTIFIGQQVRNPPGGEHRENKVDAELGLIHGNLFGRPR